MKAHRRLLCILLLLALLVPVASAAPTSGQEGKLSDI